MNWLDLFRTDKADEPEVDEYQNRSGRVISNNAFGGDEEKQRDFARGFGSSPPRKRNYSSDDGWIYPESRDGQVGHVRLRESTGWNGLRTRDGKRMLLEVKEGNRWRRIRDQEEALEVLRELKNEDDQDGERMPVDPATGLREYRDQRFYR